MGGTSSDGDGLRSFASLARVAAVSCLVGVDDSMRYIYDSDEALLAILVLIWMKECYGETLELWVVPLPGSRRHAQAYKATRQTGELLGCARHCLIRHHNDPSH